MLVGVRTWRRAAAVLLSLLLPAGCWISSGSTYEKTIEGDREEDKPKARPAEKPKRPFDDERWYERVGPDPNPPPPPEEREPPRRTRPVSRPRSQAGIPVLLVDSVPPGADILLDGERKGKTPVTFSGLSIGEHTIRLELANLGPHEETIRYEGGQQIYRVDLWTGTVVERPEDAAEAPPEDPAAAAPSPSAAPALAAGPRRSAPRHPLILVQWSGAPGLLFVPTPVVAGASKQLSLLGMMHAGELGGRTPVALGWREVRDAIELAGQLALILERAPRLPGSYSNSFKLQVLDSGPPAAAFLMKGCAQWGTGSDTYANFSGFGFGFPVAYRVGPVVLLASPEMLISSQRVTYDQTYNDPHKATGWFYGRLGVLVDLHRFQLGASAALRSVPLTQGWGLDLPFQVGVEAHAPLSFSSPWALSLIAAGELEDRRNFYLMSGIGIIRDLRY